MSKTIEMNDNKAPKGVFVHQKDFCIPPTGVDSKIMAQINCMKSEGIECYSTYSEYTLSTFRKVMKRLPFVSDQRDWSCLTDQFNLDFAYIRKPYFVSSDFIEALRVFRANNETAKILLEIPTYPYDAELMRFAQVSLLAKDVLHRGSLRQVVDRIVCFSDQRAIFGIPTINIVNGIDLKSLSPRKPTSNRGEINIICVACFADWHGVDRLIEGLRRYAKEGGKENVRVHLLGEGPSLESIRRQVDQNDLSDRVLFYGLCSREQMDVVFDKCTLAIECLGTHRKKLALSSSLKSREYLAKGIPFVYAGLIDVLKRDPVDFCFRVPADDSPIDINDLILFHNSLYSGEPQQVLIRRIRAYAEKRIDINLTMKPVTNYIKENCCDGK